MVFILTSNLLTQDEHFISPVVIIYYDLIFYILEKHKNSNYLRILKTKNTNQELM